MDKKFLDNKKYMALIIAIAAIIIVSVSYSVYSVATDQCPVVAMGLSEKCPSGDVIVHRGHIFGLGTGKFQDNHAHNWGGNCTLI